MRCAVEQTLLRNVYFCLCIISGRYSSHTYAGREPGGNLSSSSSSFVTIYQGGIAHFNIPPPAEEIRSISTSTVLSLEISDY